MGELKIETIECWYYEIDGERSGPISEGKICELIKSNHLSLDNSVWKEGFKDWKSIQDTDLSIHFDKKSPPPLMGDKINNSIVWALAFAPIFGLLLENFFAGIFQSKVSSLWFITLALNITLCYMDEVRLRKAGHSSDKLKSWVWLVPVYLFQRAKLLKQKYSYFAAWMMCFSLIMFATPSTNSPLFSISDSKEIQIVKTGSLSACPLKTVESSVNSFFGSPKWESGKAEDGTTFVNISGDMTYAEKPVRATVQFIVDSAGKSFNYRAFEINGVSQNNFIASALIQKMCGN